MVIQRLQDQFDVDKADDSRNLLYSYDFKNFKENGRMTIQATSNYGIERFKDSNELLAKMTGFRYQASAFLQKITAWDWKIGDSFPLMIESSTSGEAMVIRYAQLINGTTCEKCNKHMPVDLFPHHQATWNCLIDEGQLKAAKLGYEPLGDHKDALAVRMALTVPSSLVPDRFTVHAPKWVHEAIEKYHTNGDQYAGMSLSEFLTKLNSEPQ